MHKETLWESIVGVTREIHRREAVIFSMARYLKSPGTAGGQYSMKYIYANGPRIKKEILRLKIIRVELFYQYNLKLLGI